MVMNIEIAESWTDYSSVATPPCSLTMNWIISGSTTGWFALSAGLLDASDWTLKLTNNSPERHMTHMFAAGTDKVTIAYNFNWYEWGSNGMPAMGKILSLAGATQFYWTINTVGKMVFIGENGVTMATSETNFLNDIIYRCCIRVEYVGGGLANLDVSVNGYNDPGLSVAGVDLQDDTATEMGGIRIHTGALAQDMGDMELLDLMVGTGECVDWGPIELVNFYANVDIVSDWTPLSGTDNWAMIDDVNADGDTTYNSTETLNAKDIYGFADGEVPESVVAVGLCSWHRKEDSATRRWRHVLRTGAVDFNGADVFASDSYGRRIDFWTTNPDTVAPWDPADLAGVEGGYEYLGA